jgi:hypothetical protein
MPIFRRRRLPRRRLLRPVPLPGARGGVPRGALHQLRRANRLMNEGAFARAASIYEELADEAQVQGIWRSPQLNLRAGLGWLMAGELSFGMNRILNGLRLMPEMGQAGRLPIVLARIKRNLEELGLQAQAASLDPQIQSLISETAPAPTPPPSHERLPAKCPHCGGNVLPDEIEWVDAHSALCDYCGSLIRSTT